MAGFRYFSDSGEGRMHILYRSRREMGSEERGAQILANTYCSRTTYLTTLCKGINLGAGKLVESVAGPIVGVLVTSKI